MKYVWSIIIMILLQGVLVAQEISHVNVNGIQVPIVFEKETSLPIASVQGSYIGQLALMFGANDLGSTMMEENVVKAAGAANRMNQAEMVKLIKDIGSIPAKRDTSYRILEKFA